MYADREEEALARRQQQHNSRRRRRDTRSVSPVSPVSRRSLSPSRSPPTSRSYRRDSYSRRSPSPGDGGLARERELQEQLRRRALRSRRQHEDGSSKAPRSEDEDRGERHRERSVSSSKNGDRRVRNSHRSSNSRGDARRKRSASPSSSSYSRRERSPRRPSYSRRRASDDRERDHEDDEDGRGYASPPYHATYNRRPRYRYSHPPSPPRHQPRRRSPVADDYDLRSVFCSQLAARLTQRDLGEFFEEKLGEGVVLDVRIVMDRLTGRSKGVGYVELSDEALVGQAIGLSDTPLFGIPIIVQKTDAARNGSAGQPIHIDPSGVPSAASRLYVGNLHFSLTETDVRSIFEPFGAIVAIDLHREPGSQKSKGFAFVQFINADIAGKAIEHMNGFELAGRQIKVGHVNALAKAGDVGGTSVREGAVAAMEATGSTATLTSSFDEGGGGGLTASGRQALMEMLARTDVDKKKIVAATDTEQQRPSSIPQSSSRGVLLKNMFNADEETDRDWDKELAQDVREECEAKYGKVEGIKVDKDSGAGEIWLRFINVEGAKKAVEGLNGRFFGGRSISAAFISEGFLTSMMG